MSRAGTTSGLTDSEPQDAHFLQSPNNVIEHVAAKAMQEFELQPSNLIAAHTACDWGDTPRGLIAQNQLNLSKRPLFPERVESHHRCRSVVFVVVTQWTRAGSATTITTLPGA